MKSQDGRGRKAPARRGLVPAAIIAGAALALAIFFIATGSAGAQAAPPAGAPVPAGGVAILTLNAQNLFDGDDDGLEYPEFSVAEGTWSAALAKKRVGLIASLISSSVEGGPDIVCLQEVENLDVLEALARACSPAYPHLALLPSKASPINCALLSRHPILRFQGHASSETVRRRLILEAEIEVAGRTILVLVNHWKSKLEGARETEPKRLEEALTLAAVLRERACERPWLDIVACGDFNEGPDEAAKAAGSAGGPYAMAFPSAAHPASIASARAAIFLAAPSMAAIDAAAIEARAAAGEGALTLADPWLAPATPASWGSYWYGGAFERIDHFLLARSLFDGAGFEYAGFSPIALPAACDAAGRPREWSSRTGAGYTDHLPLLLTLR